MPLPVPPEQPKRMEMRKALHRLINHITRLSVDEIDMFPSTIDQLQFQPMVLDENSTEKPIFFTPYPASLLPDPSDEHDRKYEMEYRTFDSKPDDFRDPKSCARTIDDYFSHYLMHCFYGIPDQDLVWSSVK